MATGKTLRGADIPDDLTTCPICFEVFSSPKLLPCLHTFCKSCLITYISQASQKKNSDVCCPVCRADVDLANVKDLDGWVEALPTNFVVNSLIERRQLESGERKCDACRYNDIDVTATSWCKECSEALCENCVKVHKWFKTTRDHAIVTLQAAEDVYFETEEVLDCPLHKNRKIELFCYDHELPCCLTCMTVHHRKCDKVTTLDEAAENFRESSEVLDILKRLKSMVNDYGKELENHEAVEREFESQIRDVSEKIMETKENMLMHVETLFKSLNDEVTALKKNREAGNEKEKLLQQKMQLELAVKTLDTMKSKSSNIALFLEYYKLKAKEKKHSDVIEKHKADCEKQTVGFVLSDNVKAFNTLITSLGEIRISSSPCYAQTPVSVDLTSCAVEEVLTIQESKTQFTDAVFLGSDVIVAVDDSQNTIWAYDFHCGKITSLKLPSNPWALAAVSDKEVVVTLRDGKCLQFFTFDNNRKTFSSGKTISLQDIPWAIDYADCFLYYTFPQRAMKMKPDGTCIVEIGIPNSSYLRGIVFSKGDIVTSDSLSTGYITKCGLNKNIVFQHKYTQYTYPRGLTTDRSGNLYVVGYTSHNVIQQSPGGTLIRELIPASSGYIKPNGINISRTENKFLLTHQDKISVFEFVS